MRVVLSAPFQDYPDLNLVVVCSHVFLKSLYKGTFSIISYLGSNSNAIRMLKSNIKFFILTLNPKRLNFEFDGNVDKL